MPTQLERSRPKREAYRLKLLERYKPRGRHPTTPLVPYQCGWCGKSFMAKPTPPRMYCSPSCRSSGIMQRHTNIRLRLVAAGVWDETDLADPSATIEAAFRLVEHMRIRWQGRYWWRFEDYSSEGWEVEIMSAQDDPSEPILREESASLPEAIARAVLSLLARDKH